MLNLEDLPADAQRAIQELRDAHRAYEPRNVGDDMIGVPFINGYAALISLETEDAGLFRMRSQAFHTRPDLQDSLPLDVLHLVRPADEVVGFVRSVADWEPHRPAREVPLDPPTS